MDLRSVDILFIVNGEDVPVDAQLEATLATARDQALIVSRNTSRPPHEWEVRDQKGVQLPVEHSVGSFRFPPHVKLFLSLKVGAGGA
jgi:hypothetical protein